MLFFGFIVYNEANAQKVQITLDWQSNLSKKDWYDSAIVSVPSFTGNVQFGDKWKLLPVFSAEKITSGTKKWIPVISNEVYNPTPWESFNFEDLINAQLQTTTLYGTSNEKNKSILMLLPLVKDQSGIVKMLTSFDLEWKIDSNYSNTGSKRDYAPNSVLASGNWFKLGVPASGMYKIDYNYLINVLKIPSSTPLNKMGIFSNKGGMLPEENSVSRIDDLVQLPLQAADNNGNGRLDEGEFLYFYAEGPDYWTPASGAGGMKFQHVKNLYAQNAYVFFTPDQGNLLNPSPIVSEPGGVSIYTYDDYAFYEDDKYNLISSGRQWFGEKLSSLSNTLSGNLNLPNRNTAQTLYFKSAFAARSTSGLSSAELKVNGSTILNNTMVNVGPGYYDTYASESITYGSAILSSNPLNFSYIFNGPDVSAAGWLNYLEVNTTSDLKIISPYFTFRNSSNIGPGNISRYHISNANSNSSVWEITDLEDIKTPATIISGSNLEFALSTPLLREFVCFDKSRVSEFGNPNFIGKVNNQNLHAFSGTHPNMVIVCTESLKPAADALANFHISNDNLRAVSVTDQEVYNEFGGGKGDPTAIRDFMKMLYDKAAGDASLKPKYLLLYGDCSYDPIDGRTQSNEFIIPSYESPNSLDPTYTFVSDDYFGFLDLSEGGSILDGDLLDIAIGRIPANSLEQANGINNKIFTYKSKQSLGNWRTLISFIADDEDGNIHLNDCEGTAEFVRTRYNKYNIDKIYMDAFRQVNTSAGDRYPDVNNAIKNLFQKGSLTISWVGHGGIQNWAHERIFDVTDIQNLKNINNLPLVITATCDFSKFDDPAISTAGEELLLNPEGGAIGLITTVRVVYTSQNKALHDAIFSKVFEPVSGHLPSMGEITMQSKNAIFGDANTRKFSLLGDPALTLNYPKYDVVITKIDSLDLSIHSDTIGALQEVFIEGEIRDLSNNLIPSFNGFVYGIVFDKLQTVKSLNNDKLSSGAASYKIQKNAIYRGKSSVSNGKFSFRFIVPKDIDYSIGQSKISCYADDGNADDAAGYSYDLTLGGFADTFKEDNLGPKITLFMNDESFRNQGITNQNPVLLAKFEDESGINSVGAGIGHDISGVLDGDIRNQAIMNEFYESELNNFRKGQLKFPYRNLTMGMHTLQVKAWDVYNNPGNAEIQFLVAEKPLLAVRYLMNYPNPVTDKTQFTFEHNRAEESLILRLEITDLQGNLVKTFEKTSNPTGFREAALEWDGLDEFGKQCNNGLYVYRLTVQDEDGAIATAFEKLVLLK